MQNLNSGIVELIGVMQKPDSGELANRCGEVLDQCVVGFGLGTETAAILIGIGRALIGGTAQIAAPTVGLTNPVAMACAAMGAIYYGWSNLKPHEKETILHSVGAVFGTGLQLTRSIILNALELMQALFATFAKLKRAVAQSAADIGVALSQITHATSDRAQERLSTAAGLVVQTASLLRNRLPSRNRDVD